MLHLGINETNILWMHGPLYQNNLIQFVAFPTTGNKAWTHCYGKIILSRKMPYSTETCLHGGMCCYFLCRIKAVCKCCQILHCELCNALVTYILFFCTCSHFSTTVWQHSCASAISTLRTNVTHPLHECVITNCTDAPPVIL